MSEDSFHNNSKEIVKNFLQSIVFIDDRLWVEAENPITPLQVPGTVQKEEKKTDLEKKEPPKSVINTQTVAASFAKHGLICGLYQPTAEGVGSLIKPAKRADCVILDWDLDETAGKIGDGALTLIQKIVEDDKKNSKRKRLIVIYTGHASDIEEINTKTAAKCPELKWHASKVKAFTDTGLYILVWSKPGKSAPTGIPIVEEINLADQLIEDFTNLSEGLLSNMVLAGLSAIRDNSHALLARFASELDPAFIAHRIYSGDPDDSENHAVALLADELQLILVENRISKSVSIDPCLKFIERKNPSFDPCGRGSPFTNDEWRILLNEGLGDKKINNTDDRKWLNQASSKEREKKAHKAFDKVSSSFGASPNIDECFATLTVLQQPYGNREQLLTLGTIVEFEKETESKVKYKIYLLCLQPLCDSIRLTDPRLFPFLLLENVAAGKAFHILAPVNNSYLHLKIDSHAYNCSMITFPPSSGKKAVYTSSDSVFVDDKRNKYRWLGQLKWSYAQKVVNEFASQTCRVGVDQSEWIRRQNPDVRNNND